MRSLALAISLVCAVASWGERADAGCVVNKLRTLVARNKETWSTYENVQRNSSAFSTLQNPVMSNAIRRATESGRLKMVRVIRKDNPDGPGFVYEAVPTQLEFIPGRYYPVVRLPNNRGLAIAEFPDSNGIHIRLASSQGVLGRNSSNPNGQAIGGVFFFDDGARVSGRAQKISSRANANEIAGELERMGIPVRFKTQNTIMELNSPADRDWSGSNDIRWQGI